jgi:hypothetical protein
LVDNPEEINRIKRGIEAIKDEPKTNIQNQTEEIPNKTRKQIKPETDSLAKTTRESSIYQLTSCDYTVPSRIRT